MKFEVEYLGSFVIKFETVIEYETKTQAGPYDVQNPEVGGHVRLSFFSQNTNGAKIKERKTNPRLYKMLLN
jgi:hypothetical protein